MDAERTEGRCVIVIAADVKFELTYPVFTVSKRMQVK